MEKIINFFKEVKVEFTKVTWPTKSQALKSVAIVVLISLAVAAYLGALDRIIQKILFGL